ncbi:hypothetical protein IAD21_04582 [Abditibacteriota bacterium]|nr:hypothetical protein IAD21_04582 [Abditibacteriota bacterium]
MRIAFFRSTSLPLLVGAGALLWSLNLKSQAQEVVPAPAIPDATIDTTAPTLRDDAFTPVVAALAASQLSEAKALLIKMKADGLGPTQFSRWENLAARTAVRLGDSKWLAKLNEDSNNGTSADELLTISALRLVLSNRLDEAQKLLDSIKDPDAMSEIPRRRYDQLQLKIAQLHGDAPTETKWAGKLVEFVGSWDSTTCQSCHANPKVSGTDVTSLDLNNWWVGERYVELLKQSNSADVAVKEAQAALKTDPKDESAKIKLAYALRAQGDNARAEAKLREIPWTAWPDRPFKKPLRFAVFP